MPQYPRGVGRAGTALLSALILVLTAFGIPGPQAVAAEDASLLDVSYSGSFSNGNRYTAATGETLGGTLARRAGSETLDPERGLVLGGGGAGAGFTPADAAFGTATLDRGFVVEAEFRPGATQSELATLLAVGGNLVVRYQGGKLRYSYDAQVGGAWTSRIGQAEVPAPGAKHVFSLAYLPTATGASMVAYLDGAQLPDVQASEGRAALNVNRPDLVGIGNDVHPSALNRGFAGSVRKTRFAPVSGEFSPSMFNYQNAGSYLRHHLHTSFSGAVTSGAYEPAAGEVVDGRLAVRGGEIEQAGALKLAGAGSGLSWDGSTLGDAPLGRSVLAEAVIAPGALSGPATLIDIAGAVRLERMDGDTVRLRGGTAEATRELPPPADRSGLTFHHLGLLSDLDATGDGTLTLFAAGKAVGEPVPVTGVSVAARTVDFLMGAAGTAYGVAVTTGAQAGDLQLGGLPCTRSVIDPANRISVTSGECAASVLSKASALRPSQRQTSWQEAERTAFLHFGMNTFTGNEWGHGDENPDLFDPTDLDTDQWARSLKDNGFRYAILTVKHHDGFVLFPSRYTGHDVAASTWKDGQGDVLKSFTDSARRYGLKVGLYLSPSDWNQYHEGVFANGSAKSERTIPTLVEGDDRAGQDIPSFTFKASDYGAYFLNQLYETLTQYGPVDEVWFDGADGGIPNASRESYDFTAYYALIRALAPQAAIAVAGPDVRWVGNESGLARENEWSTIPVESKATGEQRVVPSGTAADIGSDEALVKAPDAGAKELVWWPSEVDVSIRPGWFYHDSQSPKSVSQLRDIYYRSVGRNSVLLLNIPPDRRGRLPDADVKRLAEWNTALRKDMPVDLALGATATTDGTPAPQVTDGDNRTAAVLPDGSGRSVTLDLGAARTVDRLVINEDIADGGQQVRTTTVEARAADGSWTQVATTGTVGYQRILALPAPVTTDAMRIRFTSARGPVHLASVSVYGAAAEAPAQQTAYYVDCTAPRAGTGSADRPLNSLGQLREINLPPSAEVRVKAGTTCRGGLDLQGYGTAEAPAVLGMWGGGAAPRLIGAGNAAAAERLRSQGWEIRGVRMS
ncbi:alpha-L-fucosidase [Streptomyces sp. NPDC057136]|uniref:alpha-L-fucosidase n=1 Tax=Streptomyces sp. NPDC057136 TaxID=3346029 RepID=UPI003629D02C